MEIRLLNEQETQTVRAAFVQKFVLDWPKYQIDHKDFIQRWGIEISHFDDMLMWDRFPKAYPCVTFREALAMLRQLPGQVLFLSEGPDYPYARKLQWDGREIPHFSAIVDAKELADRIEYEWIESARLFQDMCYLADQALPEDLYVCTQEMDRLLVFTHETTDCDAELAENYLTQAESRLCIAYGFDDK